MIRKSLLMTFIFFVLYNIIIVIVDPPRGVSKSQHQWQKNVIKAQEYIYESKDSKVVLVGTSLTFRLPEGIFHDKSYNLAMAGTSVYAGLDIIKRSSANPEVILIESNCLMNNLNSDVVGNVFMPLMDRLREWLPALREKNQPLCYVNALEGLIRSKILLASERYRKMEESDHFPGKKKQHKDKEVAKEKNRQEVVARNLQNLFDEFSKVPEETIINSRMELLKNYIDYFEKRGVRVVFYEMPIHEKLYNSPRAQSVREALEKNFPREKYLFIVHPAPGEFQTTDGVHLVSGSAGKFAEFLQHWIQAQNL